MEVYAWLINFAHFRENCPMGIIPEWMQKVTPHNEIIQCCVVLLLFAFYSALRLYVIWNWLICWISSKLKTTWKILLPFSEHFLCPKRKHKNTTERNTESFYDLNTNLHFFRPYLWLHPYYYSFHATNSGDYSGCRKEAGHSMVKFPVTHHQRNERLRLNKSRAKRKLVKSS